MTVDLSKRMQAVADMVPAGHIAADVGCDHGFVSIYLIQKGICPFVYAADVRPGPLGRAKEHILQYGLQDFIVPVLSDGLREVPVGESGADVMIAAGMGGKLTVRILQDAASKTAQLSACVLEPQSEVWLVRRHLEQTGFVIVRENMVFEEGKYYPVIFAVNERRPENIEVIRKARGQRERLRERLEAAGLTDGECKRAEEWLGALLILEKNAVLLSYLEHTIKQDTALLEEMPLPGKAGEDMEKLRRISLRRAELLERLSLAGRVREMVRVHEKKGCRNDSQSGWKRI